ncbi:MAG: hypothetical protein JKY45_10810 [Emcibacter sp.]|nr:hypothetical protein [Emcibacter sp.]
MFRFIIVSFLGFLISSSLAFSETNDVPVGRHFESQHQAKIGGKDISYKAIVEETFLTDNSGKPAASIVSFSYIRTDIPKNTNRPVIFVFNGGPGSSSIWLHMGLVGPRRVSFGDDVKPETVPPFQLADNPDSPLDKADIVLFDPPGTGFSRILPSGKAEQFFGVAQDAKATANFIKNWIRKNKRWNSPKYLMGESYGTVRAAVVAKYLAGGPMGSGSMDGVTLNGVILLGQSMDMGGRGDVSYTTALPSMAATAWYHKKIDRTGRTLEQPVAEASAFAEDEYLAALYSGARLLPQERDRIADKLAQLISLDPKTIISHNLRISMAVFSRELLVDEGLQVGLYDSRYTLPLDAHGGDPVADDPAMGQYVPGFIATFNNYINDELGVEIDDFYLSIEFHKVNGRWNYGFGPGVPPNRNFATDIATAMRRNPYLRLFVGTGWYDLVTTAGKADYVIGHSGILLAQTEFHYYSSGHMPYLGPKSRTKLSRDLRKFIQETSK